MKEAIFDPPIPYIGAIGGGRFSPGKIVRIQGVAPNVAYRFDINLQCGPKTVPRDDVAIQVAVKVLDGYISINSLQNGIWGDEKHGAALPINRAEKFEIIILCDFSQYRVVVNGQNYCEFPQRIHHDRITHLAIDGDVSIIQISYESDSGNGAAPTLFPPIAHESDGFEMINASSARALPIGIHPPPSSPGFSAPPSYDAAIEATARPPYPTGDTTGMPYPKSVPGVTGTTPYPLASDPRTPLRAGGGQRIVIPPPATDAPVPLNATSYNFQPASSNAQPSFYRVRSGDQCTRGRWAVVGVMFIIILIMILYAYLRYRAAHSH